MGLGIGEIVVLGFILLFILSASQLGRMGNALGKFVYSFRKAARGDDFVDVKGTPSLHPRERKTGRLPDAQRVDEEESKRT